MSRWLRFLATSGLFLQFLWPRYFFINVGGIGVNPYTLGTISLLLLCLGAVAFRPGLRREVAAGCGRSKMLVTALLLYWFWRLFADGFGVSPGNSLFATMQEFLYTGSWFVIAMIIFADHILQRRLQTVMFVSALIATAAGVVEYQTQTKILSTLGLTSLMAGDQYMANAINTSQLREGVLRVQSLFGHPIIYGQIMAAMLPVALHFILRGGIARLVPGILFVAAIATSASVSNTRSPLIVGVTATILYLALNFINPRRASGLVLGLLAGAAALIAMPVLLNQTSTVAQGSNRGEAASTEARAIQIARGTQALSERPISGYGSGNSLELAGVRGIGKLFLSVDNYYVTDAVDHGYVGGVILLMFLVAILLAGFMVTLRTDDPRDRSLTAAYTSMAIGLAVGFLVISIPDMLSVIFLIAGYLVARAGQVGQAVTHGRRPARARGPVVSGAPFVSGVRS